MSFLFCPNCKSKTYCPSIYTRYITGRQTYILFTLCSCGHILATPPRNRYGTATTAKALFKSADSALYGINREIENQLIRCIYHKLHNEPTNYYSDAYMEAEDILLMDETELIDIVKRVADNNANSARLALTKDALVEFYILWYAQLRRRIIEQRTEKAVLVDYLT